MFAVVPAVVGASAGVEAGLAGVLSGAAGGVAPVLALPPMGADGDSVKFSALAAAVGAHHVAVSEQHAAMRGLYAGAQSLAMTTTVATEVMRAAAAAI
ncbi:MAG: PE domain-containing protein [Mycobacterium sp.]